MEKMQQAKQELAAQGRLMEDHDSAVRITEPSVVFHPSDHESVLHYLPSTYYHAMSAAPGDFTPKDLHDAASQERCIVLLGLPDAALLRDIAGKALRVLVFSPAPAYGAETDEVFTSAVAAPNVFFFLGPGKGFRRHLDDIPDAGPVGTAFPAVYTASPEMSALYKDIVEYVEILFFRKQVYPLCSHDLKRSLPVRPIAGRYYYDQMYHLYANIPEYLHFSGMDVLRGGFGRGAAMIAAPGPGLDRCIEYIRENRSKMPIIAVNNALKPLLEHGVEPHFAVTVDNSLLIRASFAGLPRAVKTVLVSHCFSYAGGDRFSRKLFFDNMLPQGLPRFPNLRRHGSVLTAAFSLAVYMGFRECVFIGAGLSSESPYGLQYARGAVPETATAWEGEIKPILFPLQSITGRTVYTSPHFRDVSLWLSRAVEEAGVKAVNTDPNSIITAPGAVYDPEYAPGEAVDADMVCAELKVKRRRPPKEEALRFIGEEAGFWRSVRRDAASMRQGDVLRQESLQVFRQFEANTVSYQVQRFRDFDNSRFHELFFESNSDADRRDGLIYYYEYVHGMAETYMELLTAAGKRVKTEFL